MKQIVCFGDSNTYGLIPGTTDCYDWNTRWTGIVGEEMSRQGYLVQEEGLCGRTTIFDDPLRAGRRGTELLPVILETHNPIDIVILMLGTNDCKSYYGASAEVIGLGIRQLIQQIKAGVPDAKLILVSPIQLGEDIWDGYDLEFDQTSVETSKDLPRVYQRIAKEEGIAYLAASDYAKPSFRDREHMDETGHRQLANGILKLLRSA